MYLIIKFQYISLTSMTIIMTSMMMYKDKRFLKGLQHYLYFRMHKSPVHLFGTKTST